MSFLPIAASAFWVLAFLAAGLGWGRVVAGLAARDGRADGSEIASWGLALLVAVGGFLNLLGAVGPGLLVALLGVGVALAPGAWRRLPRSFLREEAAGPLERSACAAVLAVIVALAVLRTTGSFAATTFNPADDYLAYFTLPTKLLQTGSLGEDPFSGRRNLSELGGGHFLNAFVLVFFPHGSLNLLDKGAGFLLLLASLVAVQRELGHGRRLLLLGALLVTMLPPPQLNVSILLLGSALLLQLLRALSRDAFWRGHLAETVPVIFLAAALAALKTSLLVLAALILTGAAIHALFTEAPRITGARLALVGGGSLLLLAPWLVSNLHSSGTLLFPVFGTGYHTLPPVSAPSTRTVVAILLLALPYLAGALVLLLERRIRESCPTARRRTAVALLLACSVGTIAIGLATTGSGFGRHPFPALLLVHLLFGTSLLAIAPPNDARRRYAYALVGAALLLPLLAGAVYYRPAYRAWVRNVAIATTDPAVGEEALRERIAELQESVPTGATILTHLDRPYLLDFRRNRILLSDYAGTFSLPPGMPLEHGPEALRAYLLSHAIRYLAYAHSDVERVLPLLPPGKRYPWLVTTLEHQQRFEEVVVALRSRSQPLYERDGRFVLDLTVAVPGEGRPDAAPKVSGRSPSAR